MGNVFLFDLHSFPPSFVVFPKQPNKQSLVPLGFLCTKMLLTDALNQPRARCLLLPEFWGESLLEKPGRTGLAEAEHFPRPASPPGSTTRPPLRFLCSSWGPSESVLGSGRRAGRLLKPRSGSSNYSPNAKSTSGRLFEEAPHFCQAWEEADLIEGSTCWIRDGVFLPWVPSQPEKWAFLTPRSRRTLWFREAKSFILFTSGRSRL